MKTAIALSLTAASLFMLASPAQAQQSVQDFTLPPNPTPTPTVEGPIDDSGLVPILPRAIPSETPTPTPSPTEAEPTSANTEAGETGEFPSVTASRTPVVQEIPDEPQRSRTVPRQSAPPESAQDSRPPAEVDPAPLQAPSRPNFNRPVETSPADPAPSFAQEAEPMANGLPDWWTWVIGLLVTLLAGLGGGWWLAQRRNARPAPKIEPPVVGAAGTKPLDDAPSTSAPSLRLTLEPEQLMRSVMMLTLHYRLIIANRSDVPLQNIRIAADLISARRAAPVEQQLATSDAKLPYSAQVDRIGPQQTATFSGQLQLPLSEIEIFQQGQTPLCVPLARFRVDAEGIETQLRTFLVGLGSNDIGGKVHPLPLSGPPGGYEGVRVRSLD